MPVVSSPIYLGRGVAVSPPLEYHDVHAQLVKERANELTEKFEAVAGLSTDFDVARMHPGRIEYGTRFARDDNGHYYSAHDYSKVKRIPPYPERVNVKDAASPLIEAAREKIFSTRENAPSKETRAEFRWHAEDQIAEGLDDLEKARRKIVALHHEAEQNDLDSINVWRQTALCNPYLGPSFVNYMEEKYGELPNPTFPGDVSVARQAPRAASFSERLRREERTPDPVPSR